MYAECNSRILILVRTTARRLKKQRTRFILKTTMGKHKKKSKERKQHNLLTFYTEGGRGVHFVNITDFVLKITASGGGGGGEGRKTKKQTLFERSDRS